jgi:ribosomal protein L22
MPPDISDFTPQAAQLQARTEELESALTLLLFRQSNTRHTLTSRHLNSMKALRPFISPERLSKPDLDTLISILESALTNARNLALFLE